MLIASRSKSVIYKLKKDLSFEFEMNDLGEAKKVLSMEIKWDRKSGKVCLTQKGGTSEVQHQWWHKVYKHTVGLSHFKLKVIMSPTTVKEREYVSRTLCSVGSLIYAMVCTMPDLSQVVSMISRYIHDTSRGHWRQWSGFYNTSKVP